MMPFNIIHEWLEKEKEAGCANPEHVVLATTTPEGIPHSRVVAIRELNPEGILFFTQRGKRKVLELTVNPHASMTLWLALQQREVIFDGKIIPLSPEENQKYWETIPRERQLRFSIFSPISEHPISSPEILEEKYLALKKTFIDQIIPMSEHYCGFRLVPETLYFYISKTDTLSEYVKYYRDEEQWKKILLSP